MPNQYPWFAIMTGDRPGDVTVVDMLNEDKNSILSGRMYYIHGSDNWNNDAPWTQAAEDYHINKNRWYATVPISINMHSKYMIEKSKYLQLIFKNSIGTVYLYGKVLDSWEGDGEEYTPDFIIEEMTSDEVEKVLKKKKVKQEQKPIPVGIGSQVTAGGIVKIPRKSKAA